MTDHSDELAWHLIGGLPASEREHSIKAVGDGRGYPLARSEAATRPRVSVDAQPTRNPMTTRSSLSERPIPAKRRRSHQRPNDLCL